MQDHVPTVRQFMTPNPVIIDGGLSIADAFTRMFQIHARHLPVYVQDHLVGILSDRDIGHLSAVQGIDPNKCTAEQACSPNPYVCAPDTSLEEVAQVLAEHRFGAALVMEEGKLVGMFTVVDALQALVAVLRRDAAQAADPNHSWSVSSSGPGPDLDYRDEHRGPDLDHNQDRSDSPDLVHTPDPRRDGLQTIENRRHDITGPALQIGGPLSGASSDIRSDLGQRAAIRRAGATVRRSADTTPERKEP
jgi:acetoin utilization protein AcuB